MKIKTQDLKNLLNLEDKDFDDLSIDQLRNPKKIYDQGIASGWSDGY